MNSDQVQQIQNILKFNKNINKVYIYFSKNILSHSADISLSVFQLYNIPVNVIKNKYKFAQKKNLQKVHQNGIIRELETLHPRFDSDPRSNSVSKIYKDILIDQLHFQINPNLLINIVFLQYQKISSQLGSNRNIDYKEEYINESFKINSKTYINQVVPLSPDSSVSPYSYCNYNHHISNDSSIIVDGIQSILQTLFQNNLLNK